MKSWLWGSILVIVAIAASLVAGFAFHQIDWLHGVVIFFTVYGMLLLVVPIVGRPKPPMKNDCYRPFVSILIPARNEEDVIEATVRSLAKLQYRKNGKPSFEILVLDDGSTDQTPAILHRLEQEMPGLVRTMRRAGDRAGKGKSAVLNEGLLSANGEIIAVFDADTRVEPNFLVKTVAYLYDPQVGGVQGRVRIYNPKQNILTAMQEDEFSVIAHLVQMAKDGLRGLTALGGNGQLTRRSALEAVGGWNEMSTTEDLDLTLRFLLKGFCVRYCPEAILWQEAVPGWRALLRQRVRWSEGFIKCVFDYTLPMLFARIKWTQRWDGFLSLVRVLIPIWVIIGYLLVAHGKITGTYLPTQIPHWLYIAASAGFFLVTFVGIWRVQTVSVADATVRVLRFWAYNFIWVLAVPMGMVACMRNLNTIVWDKTEHRGDRPVAAVPSVAPLSYRPSTAPSLVEVID